MSSAAIGRSSIVGMHSKEEGADEGRHGIEEARHFTVKPGSTRHGVKSRLVCQLFGLYPHTTDGCLQGSRAGTSANQDGPRVPH